jgi:hypothetical protein
MPPTTNTMTLLIHILILLISNVFVSSDTTITTIVMYQTLRLVVQSDWCVTLTSLGVPRMNLCNPTDLHQALNVTVVNNLQQLSIESIAYPGLCLDAHSSYNNINGQPVIQWPKNLTPNQLWTAGPAADPYLRLVATPSMCLDLFSYAQSGINRYAPVQMWSCQAGGSINQHWQLVPTGFDISTSSCPTPSPNLPATTTNIPTTMTTTTTMPTSIPTSLGSDICTTYHNKKSCLLGNGTTSCHWTRKKKCVVKKG